MLTLAGNLILFPVDWDFQEYASCTKICSKNNVNFKCVLGVALEKRRNQLELYLNSLLAWEEYRNHAETVSW